MRTNRSKQQKPLLERIQEESQCEVEVEELTEEEERQAWRKIKLMWTIHFVSLILALAICTHLFALYNEGEEPPVHGKTKAKRKAANKYFLEFTFPDDYKRSVRTARQDIQMRNLRATLYDMVCG